MKLLKGGFVLLLAIVAFMVGCEPPEDQFDPNPSQKLRFMADTVYFDTLFVTFGSVTKRLRVYNPNPKAVKLSAFLSGGNNNYSIIVNGRRPGPVDDLELRGNDSMYVFVKVTIDPNDKKIPFLIEDNLLFSIEGQANTDTVHLVAYGRNANFITKQTICNQLWDSDLPFVLVGQDDTIGDVIYQNMACLVPKGCTLNIAAGSEIYVYNNTNIFVEGTLLLDGTRQNPIIIKQTRKQEEYEETPGQWGALVYLNESKGNRISFTTIKNGSVVQVGTPNAEHKIDLTIEYSNIRNMSGFSIYAFGADILAYNSVFSDGINGIVACLEGGNYFFAHNTIAYSGNFNSRRENPAAVFTDIFTDGSTIFSDSLRLTFLNNIVSGPNNEEIGLGTNFPDKISLDVRRNIYSTRDKSLNPLNNLSVTGYYNQFKNAHEYDFSLDTLAMAQDSGIQIITNIGGNIVQFPFDDYMGTNRDTLPDIGAFERKK